MSGDKQNTGNPLEQFVLLAKSAKGAAALELIKQVLEAPGLYVFGELLNMPHMQELAGTPGECYLNLLNIFAYGTYSDYKAHQANLPELTTVQLNKLRHLTIVSLATKNKCIPYPVLLQELELKNLRELEDLIIEVIYADVIHGKLDQRNQQLEVDYAIGRDIRPEAVTEIISVLQEWCDGCDAVLKGIESQIVKANQNKDLQNKTKEKIETEVMNIKKTLKTSQQQEMDDQMMADSREMAAAPEKAAAKKTSKTKGLRGSGGKFWGKSS